MVHKRIGQHCSATGRTIVSKHSKRSKDLKKIESHFEICSTIVESVAFCSVCLLGKFFTEKIFTEDSSATSDHRLPAVDLMSWSYELELVWKRDGVCTARCQHQSVQLKGFEWRFSAHQFDGGAVGASSKIEPRLKSSNCLWIYNNRFENNRFAIKFLQKILRGLRLSCR